MPNYIFAYHGGKKPDTPEEGTQIMNAWKAWFADMGDALVEMGAPVGMSKTVSSDGIADDGGANPLGGYTIVKADNHDAAAQMATKCPMVVSGHGSVEVCAILEM